MVITICIINLEVVQSKNGTVGIFELYRRYDKLSWLPLDLMSHRSPVERQLISSAAIVQRSVSDQLAIKVWEREQEVIPSLLTSLNPPPNISLLYH